MSIETFTPIIIFEGEYLPSNFFFWYAIYIEIIIMHKDEA